MNDPPNKNKQKMYRRPSLRLMDYDYSEAGAYFVTLCVQGRRCLFGDVVDGEMRWNDAGQMVERWWNELENKYPSVRTDEFVVMPDHFHGIVVFVAADLRVCLGAAEYTGPGQTHRFATTGSTVISSQNREGIRGNPFATEERSRSPRPHETVTLATVVQWFKSMTTNSYIRGVKADGWLPFPGKLWQANYYEHVIRNGDSLNRAREYIINNPLKWELEQLHPTNAPGW